MKKCIITFAIESNILQYKLKNGTDVLKQHIVLHY